MQRNAFVALLIWLGLGALLGLLERPYQWLSQLGFDLQRLLWLEAVGVPWRGAALVFVGATLLIWLAWGPLAAGRGGGLTPALALQQGAPEPAMEVRLSLHTQLRRLPLMLLTHLAGMSVGVESPSASLGAAFLLVLRRRWPRCSAWAGIPLPLFTAIGAGAGLGAAFRSPLLGVTYGIEELSREKGLSLVLPTLLLAGSGALLSSRLGQPARLVGLELGMLPGHLWGWALLLTALGALLGGLFVRLLVPLAGWLAQRLRAQRLPTAVAVAALLTLLALLSGGLSLNDGSLSLAAELQGGPGGTAATLLWRYGSSLLSIAVGSPGGLMHDSMSLGSLLAAPLRFLPSQAQAQLAAIGAAALFAAANRTPLFCALFVFTLQGDPQLLVPLLLASAISSALAEPLRGITWNEAQVEMSMVQPSPGPGLQRAC
jgi:H+/Cl- antiporter ClcA